MQLPKTKTERIRFLVIAAADRAAAALPPRYAAAIVSAPQRFL